MWTRRIKSLSLEQWGHIFNIAGVLLGLVSIVSVMVQLHEHNKITRAENAQKLVELTMISNMELVKDPKLASLWTEGNENFDSLSKEDKGTFKRIWIIYLNILESAFHQREDGLIDEEDFQSRNKCLVINKNVVPKIWPELSEFYPPRFQRHVAEIIRTHESLVSQFHDQPLDRQEAREWMGGHRWPSSQPAGYR
jgi:hypothetical protein